MTTTKEQALSLFQPYATAQNFLSPEQMDRLIAEHAPLVTESQLSFGNTDANVRRSRVVFLGHEQKYAWLYQRLWAAVSVCNPQCFDVEITGVEANVQVARYDSAQRGFYNWHVDFGPAHPLRKLSISIQLSNSEDYDGGDLELQYGNEPKQLDRTKGACIIFPSFMLHRVTPVTRGVRWSLVAWVLGTRWR
jgi:predicted 2-oxoglutarate/Fe(II)-dependent dioxygenase YbiX